MRRVLIVGRGDEGEYVGQRMVDKLLGSGWATPLVAIESRRRASAGSSLKRVTVDLGDATAVRKCLEDVYGVVNCVTGSTADIRRVSAALFAAARAMASPPRIVYLSSQSVYGEACGDVDESAPPTGSLSPYGAAKVAAEHEAAGLASAIVLRPGIVYGPGSPQWSERIAAWLLRHRLGDLGLEGDGYCNLVYIDDLVQAIVAALQAPEVRGPLNLSLPQPPRWNEYLVQYAKALGAVPVSRISRRALMIEAKLLAPPLKVLQIVSRKVSPRAARLVPEPIPPSVMQLFKQEIRMSVRAAEDVLGLRWTSLTDGLDCAARAHCKASLRRH